MSTQDTHTNSHEGGPSKRWNVVRSKAVPAGVTIAQMRSSAGTTKPSQAKMRKSGETIPAALHKAPGYFETVETLTSKA